MATLSAERIHDDLFFLSGELPRRTVNLTRPGSSEHTLAEADRYLREQLNAAGHRVDSVTHRVQPFRCDRSKPMHHWYALPAEEDPWYEVTNLAVTLTGSSTPEEIVQLVAHKDSQSWIHSPGAYDNAVGAVALLELARTLETGTLERTVRLLWCNEEHRPWTSRFAAEEAAARGDDIVAVLNVDSLGGKSDDDIATGRMPHTITSSTPEGLNLARFVAACSADARLDVELAAKEQINDDDGMFINAGFRAAVMNIGSWPYADAEYHLPGDRPERVDISNVVMSTELIRNAVIALANGREKFDE